MMDLATALALSERLLAFFFLLQSAEHLSRLNYSGNGKDASLFMNRAGLSLCLLFGVLKSAIYPLLIANALWGLVRFHGPYNGGSDKMSLLALCMLTCAHFLPEGQGKEIAFGYLAVQLLLSYFISGWVKVFEKPWRDGTALVHVFAHSAYPASESLRRWAQKPQLLKHASWVVIAFELAFPLALFSQTALIIALICAFCFHLSNAFFFGLNRFSFAWLTAYPAILWLQGALFT